MGKQNKKPQQDINSKIVFATVLLKLIEAIITLITKLVE